jgi:hypothetical protein
MYAARLPTLIKAIWLKGTRLTYVAKKFMSLVVLTKQVIQMNWVHKKKRLDLQLVFTIVF